MKIELEIPKEFENDYMSDKFTDFFDRIIGDTTYGCLCGRYETETATMFIEAFKNSKRVE